MKTFEDRMKWLDGLRPAVRKKPGMYFGLSGSAALPVMVRCLTNFLLRFAKDADSSSLNIKLQTGQNPVFELSINEYRSHLITPDGLTRWFNSQRWYRWEIEAVAAACKRVVVEISNPKARCRALIQDGRQVRLSKLKATGRRRLRFICHPAEVFGNFTIAHFNTLSGFLRDQAALYHGMQTDLKCDRRNHGAWWFPDGLTSFVTQDDYGRFSLHPTPIRASATKGSLRVDVALRFVHSGPSRFWTWVNYEPVQGGAHLEGMGDALREVFPDETAGCRTIPLATNTDTSAVVNLPHTLIGAMHVQTPDPKWAGPTRDILMGDHIREFVHQALVQSIAQQWKAGREQQLKR